MAREYEKRGKKVHKLTRGGLVERDLATGEEQRVSQRGQDFNLWDRQPPRDFTPGVSVRQAINESAGRERSGHGYHQPPRELPSGYDNAAGARHDAVSDGYPPSTPYQSSEAPARDAPGASPVSEGFRSDPTRNAEQPFHHEFPSSVRADIQRHRQREATHHSRIADQGQPPQGKR